MIVRVLKQKYLAIIVVSLLSSITDESIRVVVLYLARIYDRETAGQCKRRRLLHLLGMGYCYDMMLIRKSISLG